MRSSSTARGLRFWASSTTSRQRFPWLVWVIRNASSVDSSSAFETPWTGKPNAAPTMRSVSSPSSCVVTKCPATTLVWARLSSKPRRIVVLPAPISPVMTMKPSLRETP